LSIVRVRRLSINEHPAPKAAEEYAALIRAPRIIEQKVKSCAQRHAGRAVRGHFLRLAGGYDREGLRYW
jgi:hypothetical protein